MTHICEYCGNEEGVEGVVMPCEEGVDDELIVEYLCEACREIAEVDNGC